MVVSRGALTAALLTLFLLSSLVPSAAAQLPEAPEEEPIFAIQITPLNTRSSIDVLDQIIIPLRIRDQTAVASPTGSSPYQYQVVLRAEVIGGGTGGWSANIVQGLAENSFPGHEWQAQLQIQLNPPVDTTDVLIRVNSTIYTPDGPEEGQGMDLLVRAQPFPNINIFLNETPPRLKPGESRDVEIRLQNNNHYPDLVQVQTQVGSSGLQAATPGPLMIPPKSTVTTTVSIRAPDDPFFTFGSSGQVLLRAESLMYGASATGSIPVAISGGSFHPWFAPLLLATLVAGAWTAQWRYRRGGDADGERGAPLRPEGFRPWHRVRPRDRDDERYLLLHREWRGHRKERKQVEKKLNQVTRERAALLEEQRKAEEAEEQRQREALEAEIAEAEKEIRRQQKEMQEEQKALSKAERKERRAELKAERRKRKALRKDLKRRRKEVAKAQKRHEKRLKKLRKQQAKEEKAAAKAAKKEAKAGKGKKQGRKGFRGGRRDQQEE